MEITGKIIAVLPEVGGTSKSGNEWKKQEYVLETIDQYPKSVCFQMFGADRITQAAIQLGEVVTVFFDIESREYMGRWYTNINAWKVERGATSTFSDIETPTNIVPGNAPVAEPDFNPTDSKDDLPF